jgi:hypothetical protein
VLDNSRLHSAPAGMGNANATIRFDHDGQAVGGEYGQR